MRRLWSVFLALALLTVACAEEHVETIATVEFNYPCGMYLNGPRPDSYHHQFLAWTPDGRHLIFNGGRTAMWMVNAEGTSARMLIDINPGQPAKYGFYADVSPDGSQIVYATCEFQTEGEVTHSERENYHYEIAVLELRSGERQRLTQNKYIDHYPVWSPDGSNIAFVANPPRERNINWEVHGARLFTMAVSGSDVRNAAPMLPILSYSQILANRDDARVPKLNGVALFPPVWSPDGEKLAFLVSEGEYAPLRKVLYTVRLDGTELTRLVEDVVSVASWSPDGQQLAVAKYAGEAVALFTLAADGSDEKLITTIIDNMRIFQNRYGGHYQSKVLTVSWSSGGTQILYSCDLGACVVNLEDGQVTGLVTELEVRDSVPYLAAWSPDGSRIALFAPVAPTTNYTGYVMPPALFTVARDGSDRRDLALRDDDGNLVPAHPPQD